jgi:membrane protein implicated in regulation of membrane protease activity
VRGGLVKLAGEQWSARTDDAALVLPADADVRVLRIDGATAVVGPVQRPAEDPPETPGTSP